MAIEEEGSLEATTMVLIIEVIIHGIITEIINTNLEAKDLNKGKFYYTFNFPN